MAAIRVLFGVVIAFLAVACLAILTLANAEVGPVLDTGEASQEDVIRLWEALSAEFERYVASVERGQQRFISFLQLLVVVIGGVGAVLVWVLGSSYRDLKAHLEQQATRQVKTIIERQKQRTDELIDSRISSELDLINHKFAALKTMLDREIKYRTARILVVAPERNHDALRRRELELLADKGLRVSLYDKNDPKLKDALSGADVIVYVCDRDSDSQKSIDEIVAGVVAFLRQVSYKFPSLASQPPVIVYTHVRFTADQMNNFFDIYDSLSLANMPQSLLTNVLIQAFFMYVNKNAG